MKARITLQNKIIKADLHRPIDISMPLDDLPARTKAWYVSPMKQEPVRSGVFVGSVAEGGCVNFKNISFNPHGNGTHTECVGHITPECHSVNDALKSYFYLAQLISVFPEKNASGDAVISKDLVQEFFIRDEGIEALIVRTLPNDAIKLYTDYSGTDPVYFEADALAYLAEQGVKHLLTDLPSVDKEEDGGQLAGHHAFWQYPENTRWDATITELIYVPNDVEDALYLLNLQTAPFVCDAAPSRPVLFEIRF